MYMLCDFIPMGYSNIQSLSLGVELLLLIILAISRQFAEVPFSPTNVVCLRVFHDFCLFGNAGNDDEQWVEAMALSYQRCITCCPRAVSWVIPRTEVWLWPSSYKALLICAWILGILVTRILSFWTKGKVTRGQSPLAGVPALIGLCVHAVFLDFCLDF